MDKSGMARVAAIAVPMVLIECHSGPAQMPPPNVTVVNIESSNPETGVEASVRDANDSSGARRMKPKAAAERKTELNVDIYDNCMLRARLSVINPDGSLDRVILDPKIDFTLESTQSNGTGIVCRQTWECDISHIARVSLAYGLRTDIGAQFRPSQDSGLSASFATIPLRAADLGQYCP